MNYCQDCIYYDVWYKECNNLVDLDDKVEADPPDAGISMAVRVSDDTGLNIAVKVGPLFGCNNFEPRG